MKQPNGTTSPVRIKVPQSLPAATGYNTYIFMFKICHYNRNGLCFLNCFNNNLEKSVSSTDKITGIAHLLIPPTQEGRVNLLGYESQTSMHVNKI